VAAPDPNAPKRRGKQVVRDRITSALSCLDLARQRVARCFEDFDKVVVMFSGGKDSTVCLHLALDEAVRRGRLPLDVCTFDEEAIPPETVAYMERVAAWPQLRFKWLCLPIKSSNACSRNSPFWYPWLEADRAKWVRPLPPGAVRDVPGFRLGMHLPECVPLIYGPECGTVCQIMGIRTQESMSRYRAIVVKEGDDAYRTASEGMAWLVKAYPIYDWKAEDVWRAPAVLGWDYNRAYDTMQACGLPRAMQRCSAPYAAQPLRRLHTFKECWPELWAKMIDRVPGVATAARETHTKIAERAAGNVGHARASDSIVLRADELDDAIRCVIESAVQAPHDFGGEQREWHCPRLARGMALLLSLFPMHAARAMLAARDPDGDPLVKPDE